jgi:hypothetical protein
MGVGPEKRGFVIVPPVVVVAFRGEVDDAGARFSVFFLDAVEAEVVALHRCTRNFRLANLTLPSSRARISSTHSRSYNQKLKHQDTR